MAQVEEAFIPREVLPGKSQISEKQNLTNGATPGEETSEKAPAQQQIVTHPLNSSWTLWYYLKDRNLSWEQSLMQISTFDTVEDFWGLFNHIENASKLKQGCDYNLFRSGIKPMWEDESNKFGGKWTYNLQHQRRQELDSSFIELAMMMIGEYEDPEVIDDITGIVVSVRPKKDRVSLWTRNCQPDSIMGIGELMRKCLNLPPNSLEFIRHQDTSNKRGSNVKVLRTC